MLVLVSGGGGRRREEMASSLTIKEILKGISLKNWSWIHTRASLARAVFSFKTFFDCEWRSHLLSPTTSTSWTGKRAKRVLVKCLWSEKCESIFGPLNLFIFGYVKGGVLGNNNIGIKKCTTTFLWVLNLGQVGELTQRISKSPSWRGFLKKWSPTSKIFHGPRG